MHFKTILYLDDTRTPLAFDIDVVRNYDQFVWFIENKPMPDLISLDHDLSMEHYPVFENGSSSIDIPYDSYKEKTGYDCAMYLVNNNVPVRYWNVHSMNPVGAENIRRVLRQRYPNGEVRGLTIKHSSSG